MVTVPQLYLAQVMHKRLHPKENMFRYGVYYLVLPLPAATLPSWLSSFHAADVGPRDGSDPVAWARRILTDYDLNSVTKTITLITMPKVLGYVFNPVSFYLCLDEGQALRAVICEVHNTFGEQHSYLCAYPDHRPIMADQWLEADKVFHVSPFLPRQGYYKFRFDLKENKLGIWIDYFDTYNNRQLITSLTGRLVPLTPSSLTQAFWHHPLVTLKATVLIHWHAIKLLAKGITYLMKPVPILRNLTASRHLRNKTD